MGGTVSMKRRCPAILAWLLVTLAVSGAEPVSAQTRPKNLVMPGKSFQGELPPLTEEQRAVREALEADVRMLAETIGQRNIGNRPERLAQAAKFVETSLAKAGHTVQRQSYRAGGRTCDNLFCQLDGARHPGEIVVVGAHYDSVWDCPGANDNGSGTAGLLALARSLAGEKPDRTLRLVAFANEEQPYFQTRQMGSWVYAAGCKKRKETITAMISLETIGYYSDKRGSQRYPAPLAQYYPSTGNFVGFVGNRASESLVKRSVGAFRRHAQFPSEGGSLPNFLPGVGWSDHWSFWRHGYQAIMVTDTAPFRYPHYHRTTDTPEKLDYDAMARIVDGLHHVVLDLCNGEEAAAE